jgi:hypothetical protein
MIGNSLVVTKLIAPGGGWGVSGFSRAAVSIKTLGA